LNADIRNLYEIVNELHEIAVAAAGGSISITRLSQGALSALRLVRARTALGRRLREMANLSAVGPIAPALGIGSLLPAL